MGETKLSLGLFAQRYDTFKPGYGCPPPSTVNGVQKRHACRGVMFECHGIALDDHALITSTVLAYQNKR